jgi:hypothetical protein
MSKASWILVDFPLVVYFCPWFWLDLNLHLRNGLIQAKIEGGTLDNCVGGAKGVGPPDEHKTNNLTFSGRDLANATAIELP